MCALPVQGFASQVNTDDIINGAVTTPKIADGAVTTQKIADGAVTSSKLGFSCGSGQMLLFNGSAWVCSAGIVGPQGVKGDKGDPGIQGIQGLQGVKGDKGDKGDAGIQGLQGVKGDKGDKGDTGLTGAQGLPGEQGVKGDPGATGQQGQIGLTGPVGPEGPQGPQGVKGDTGATGPAAHYANVIVVAKSGGDFTDPVAAVNSISDASASNPYLIKIMPGTYEIGSNITMKNHVSIEGSGQETTYINATYSTPYSSGGSLVVAANNSRISNLSLTNDCTNATGSECNGIFARYLDDSSNGGTLANSKISNVSINLIGNPSPYGNHPRTSIGIYTLASSLDITGVKIDVTYSQGAKGIWNRGSYTNIKDSEIRIFSNFAVPEWQAGIFTDGWGGIVKKGFAYTIDNVKVDVNSYGQSIGMFIDTTYPASYDTKGIVRNSILTVSGLDANNFGLTMLGSDTIVSNVDSYVVGANGVPVRTHQ